MRTAPRLICLAIGVAAGAVLVCRARPAPAGKADPANKAEHPAGTAGPITRAYDIRELLVLVPDFDNAPTFDPSDRPPPATNPTAVPASGSTRGGQIDAVPGDFVRLDSSLPTRDDRLKDVIDLIERTVATDTWRDNGGDGTVWERGGFLFVTQPADVHAKLAAMLAAVRQAQPRAVRLRSHWVRVQRRDLDAVLKPVGGKAGGALLEADAGALEKLPAGTVHWRGEIVCMDGQRVFLVCGPTHPPTGATDGIHAPNAAAGPARSAGVVLDVANTVSADRTSALVTVRAESVPAGPAADGWQSLRTTVRVPCGHAVLVGGMSPGPAADPDPPQTYLFLEVTSE